MGFAKRLAIQPDLVPQDPVEWRSWHRLPDATSEVSLWCAVWPGGQPPAAGSPAAECIQAIAWPAAAAQNTILAVTEMRCRAMLAGATPGG